MADGWAPGWEAGCWNSGACREPVAAAAVAVAAAGAVMGCVRWTLGMCLGQESSDPHGDQEVGFLVWAVLEQVSSQLNRRAKTGLVRVGFGVR